MGPTPGDVHVNQPLTNISIAFLQKASNFIATRVFPNIPVSKQSDRYYTYDRGEFNRDEMRERAPATESAGGTYSLDSTPTYYCAVYAFHHDIPDEVRANADSMLAPDREATEYVSHKALINREKRWAAKYFKTGVWDGEKAGHASTANSTQVIFWSSASSTPIEDVAAAIDAILQETGYEPQKLVLGRKVWTALKNHPEIVDRIKYGQTAPGPAIVTRNAVAALMEIDEILVMNAIENTAAEGATPVHQFIGGNHALLTYVTPTPGLMTPTAGYTFSWTGMMGAGSEGNRIRQFRAELKNADRVEIDQCFDQKVVAPELGYFFKDVVQ